MRMRVAPGRIMRVRSTRETFRKSCVTGVTGVTHPALTGTPPVSGGESEYLGGQSSGSDFREILNEYCKKVIE